MSDAYSFVEERKVRVAIIGGTGLETLPDEWRVAHLQVETPFGMASLWEAVRGEQEIVFVSRHGETHGLSPHQINYRANIAALRQMRVRKVLATNAVGSLRLDLVPGSVAAFDDFIDFTRARPLSYWQDHPDAPSGVVHTDFSQPYCPALRAALIEAAAELDIPLMPRATYLCTDGPRFESPAEVRMFAQWGGDVVGMTGLPEAIFARESGLCYAGVGIVTNFAAGLTADRVEHDSVVVQMQRQVAQARALLVRAAALQDTFPCLVCAPSPMQT